MGLQKLISNGEYLSHIRFADDIILISESVDDMRDIPKNQKRKNFKGILKRTG